MKVALDISAAVSGAGGIPRYLLALADALEAEGVRVARVAVGRGGFTVPASTRRLRTPLRVVRASWRVAHWPRAEDLVGAVDVVHAGSLAPPPTRMPVVMTINDLVPLDHPSWHSRRTVREAVECLRVARNAAMITTLSEAVASELVGRGLPAARIIVAPPAAARLPKPTGWRPVAGRYLLCVGDVAPRKGIPTILSALAQSGLEDASLIVAGRPGASQVDVIRLISLLGLEGRVQLLGQVDDTTLADLYAGAEAFCFPTYAEGFGMPLVEAMAAGIPVVCSDIPVTREVTGGSALFAPPGNVDSWQAALEQVVGDAALRSRLVDEGPARASVFTWRRAALATIDAYGRALEN